MTSPKFPAAPGTEGKEVQAGGEGSRGKPKVSGSGGRKRNRLGEPKGALRGALWFRGRTQTPQSAAFNRREGRGVRKLSPRAARSPARLVSRRRRAGADRARGRLLGRAGEGAAVLDPGAPSGVEPPPRQARNRVLPARVRVPRLRVVPFRRPAAPTRRRLAIA